MSPYIILFVAFVSVHFVAAVPRVSGPSSIHTSEAPAVFLDFLFKQNFIVALVLCLLFHDEQPLEWILQRWITSDVFRLYQLFARLYFFL